MPHKKVFLVTSLFICVAIFFIQCISGKSPVPDPRGHQYAGSASCGACHHDITDSYIHTHHYKTSAPVFQDQLKKFIDSSNYVIYYPDSAIVRLESKDAGFFQTYIMNGKTARSEKMDIAFGSAEKAQTYGYWKNGQLLELPLTYFTSLHRWTNSPGYRTRTPYYDRIIISRCFECHASYAETDDVQTGSLQITEKLLPNSIIYGIDCERCHGPAAEHVQFHQENPGSKQARYITSIRTLGRARQLDLCASCHSGNDRDVQRSLFAFRPGDTLARFYYPSFGMDTKEPDVHGKQMQLLQASQCFSKSNMTCITCHSAHDPEENKQDVFVTKCMQCHQPSAHAVEMKTTDGNCIDCHMPLQPAKSLDFSSGDQMKSIPYLIRTHRIAVYFSGKN